ncbi:hypothetical protein ACP4OV_023514 [Aristida adscensionis]
MGRPSTEALAMAGADWAEVHAGGGDGEEEAGAPPEHLRTLEAFLEEVVPVDMVLAFRRRQTTATEERRRSCEEDVKEKLKLWAKAVATKARRDNYRKNGCVCCV